VILYCLSGGRSALAAEALLRLGFANPMSLDHGILGWEDAGHPVVTPASALRPASGGASAAACS
jgi:rhodanese-related sulfurtransferase